MLRVQFLLFLGDWSVPKLNFGKHPVHHFFCALCAWGVCVYECMCVSSVYACLRSLSEEPRANILDPGKGNFR